MTMRDIVVVGASAGGVDALERLVSGLPAQLPASIFIVLHVSDRGPSVLPAILQRRAMLSVSHARDGEAFRHGHVYVAPPGSHMLLDASRIRLSRGPREHHTRPAIDPLFRSAAINLGPRVIGLVLTGFLDDGTAGLTAIKARGGTTIVQDPADARQPSMPRNALRHDSPEHCLPLAEMPRLIAQLVSSGGGEGREPVPEALSLESHVADGAEAQDREDALLKLGQPSVFTCPDCHGVLFEIGSGEDVRFRCRTGHAFTVLTLLMQQGEELEGQIWSAIRALEENASLAGKVAEWSSITSDLAEALRKIASQRGLQAARLSEVLKMADPTQEGALSEEDEDSRPGRNAKVAR